MKNKFYSIFALIVSLMASISLFALATGCNNQGSSSSDNPNDEYNQRLEQSEQYYGYSILSDDIFHDQADVFMDPLEPKSTDNVTVRIRTKRGNVKKATLQFTVDLDKISDETAVWHDIPMSYEIADETMAFDYFICIIPAQTRPYKYHFKLENDKQAVYYNAFECYAEEEKNVFSIDASGDFYVMPDFSTPDWSKGAVWYSIMPDSFYNADTINDKTTSSNFKIDAWGTTHTAGNYSAGLSYFGGDMLGIYEKLDYIKSFGTTGLFMNPIWFAYHNAGYGSADMTQIDSSLGNDNLLKQLTAAAHEKDMKVMLDGVFTYFTYVGTYYNSNGYYALDGANNPGDTYYDAYIRNSAGSPDVVWGNPRTDFSSKITRELVYSVPTSIMQVYILEHGIDGWRLDVGSDLRGSDADNWGDATQIIQDMRRYLKDIDEDVLLCSEGGSGTMLTDYALDTMWNFNYYYSVQDFLTQKTSNNTVQNFNSNLYETIASLPKSVANASYNFTANHDFSRTLVYADDDMAKAMGATIVNFTFTGAPCIYFGEEIGMTGAAFYDSMIWDPTQWNYRMLNLYRALCDLRQDFSEVYKDGTIKDLKLAKESGMLAFARWKGDQKVVTVMNPWNEQKTVELNVSSLAMRNGDTLTDYLTGKVYTINDGKITVEVQEGGAVLVNKNVNKYAGRFNVASLSDTDARIYEKQLNTLVLSGNGSISGTADSAKYASLPVYNNGGISFVYKTGAAYAALLRDDVEADSAVYGLVFDATGKAKVVARTQKGTSLTVITEIDFADNDEISVERTNGKYFVTVKRGDEKIAYKQSEAIVMMDYYAYAGFSPISGNAEVKVVDVFYAETEQMSDDFSMSDNSMMIRSDDVVVTDGVATLKGTGKPASYLTRSHITDFSVKTLLKTSPENGYSGVTVGASENNYITLARRNVNGKKTLSLLQCLNGTVSEFAYVDDVDGEVILQLEKVGVYYSGKYSIDGKNFVTVGSNLLSNYSDIFVGIVNCDTADAKFDYFCFGNSIEDGKSKSDHQYYGYIEYNSGLTSYVSGIITQSVTGGVWEYCVGGIEQTLETANEGVMTLGGEEFNGFKTDLTLQIKKIANDTAYVELRFGQKDGQTAMKVRLNSKGLVSLLYGEKVLDTYQIENFAIGEQYRFVVVANEENKISVFMKESPVLIMEKVVAEYKPGTQTVVCHKCAFSVTSYNAYHYYVDWQHMGGSIVIPDDQYIIQTGDNSQGAFSGYLATGLSDFVVAANVQISKTINAKDASFGYVVNGLAGAHYTVDGILIGADSTGLVSISKQGKVLASKKVDYDYQSFFFTLVVQNGNVKIFIDKYDSTSDSGLKDYSTLPVLEYNFGYSIGGSLQIVSKNAKTVFARHRIYGLRSEESYQDLDIFKERIIDSPNVKTPAKTDAFKNADAHTLSWDFSDRRQMEDFSVYSGAWYIDVDNNRLVGLGTGNWTSGLTINAGKFKNFELKYKINAHVSGAWAGALTNKSVWNDNHDDGGNLFYTNGSGAMAYSTWLNAGLGNGILDEDGYMTVTIRFYGADNANKTLYYSTGGSQNTVTVASDKYQGECFLSLVAGNCVAYFRDVTVRELDANGNYVS